MFFFMLQDASENMINIKEEVWEDPAIVIKDEVWEDHELSHNNSIDPSVYGASGSADPDSHDGVQEERTGTSKGFSYPGVPAQGSQELPEVVVEALAGPSGMQEVYETSISCVPPFLHLLFPSLFSSSYSLDNYDFPLLFLILLYLILFNLFPFLLIFYLRLFPLLLSTIFSLILHLILFLPFSIFSGLLVYHIFKLCNIIFPTLE